VCGFGSFIFQLLIPINDGLSNIALDLIPIGTAERSRLVKTFRDLFGAKYQSEWIDLNDRIIIYTCIEINPTFETN
jgi:hypothetical protein